MVLISKTDDLVAPESSEGFRILLASDLHVGFLEKDEIRKKDTITALKEVLTIAKQKKVDFVLLGGDLYDKNKPSAQCQLEVVKILRELCHGNGAVAFRFLSDPAVNFSHSKFPLPNFEDPNINVELPIFSIHGNHDDLTGSGYCALDPLHEAGLINFFGKNMAEKQVKIQPVLLEKGTTKIALFGLGSRKDERLQRLFRDKDVDFSRPQEDLDSWFNIFVLHQTRTDYGRNNKHISSSYIPSFIDLTLWGHEHEARVVPEAVPGTERDSPAYIIQPGSTVATSLDPKEAGERFVCLLEVMGQDFKATPIALRSNRQFLFGDPIVLADVRDSFEPMLKKDLEEKFKAHCAEKVERLIEKAKREREKSFRDGEFNRPDLPLIRIRVDYTDCEKFNVSRFGQDFVGLVANSTNLLKLDKVKDQKERVRVRDNRPMNELILSHAEEHQICVRDMVKHFFKNKKEDDTPMILGEPVFDGAVKLFVEDKDQAAVPTVVDRILEKNVNMIYKELLPTERDDFVGEITEFLNALRVERNRRDREEGAEKVDEEAMSEISQILNDSRAKMDEIIDVENDAPPVASTSKRGGGRGRGSGRGKDVQQSSITSFAAPVPLRQQKRVASSAAEDSDDSFHSVASSRSLKKRTR